MSSRRVGVQHLGLLLFSYLLLFVFADQITYALSAEIADCSISSSSSTRTASLLSNDVLNLEFISTKESLSVRLTSSKAGSYIGFGLSPDGKGRMNGSEVAIGSPTTEKVKLYALTQQYYQDIPESRQTLINASFTKTDDGGGILEYTRLLDDGTGNAVIDGNGKNTFIFSVGYNDDFSFGHPRTQSGSVDIDLTPCDDYIVNNNDDDRNDDKELIFVREGDNKQQILLIHGILGIIAFALCMPISASSAVVGKLGLLKNFNICNKEAWFVIHFYMNILAFILSVALFAMVVYAVGQENEEEDHFEGTHQMVGLVTFILVSVQVGFALFRPKAPSPQYEHTDHNNEEDKYDDEDLFQTRGTTNEDEQKTKNDKLEKTTIRSIWEISHRITAMGILGLGVYQLTSGLTLYQDLYGNQSWIMPFWIVLGVFWIALLGGLSFVLLSKK